MNIYEARGEERGAARGALQAKREAALIILRARFADVPPSVEAQVRALDSEAELDALFAAAQATSLDALGLGPGPAQA